MRTLAFDLLRGESEFSSCVQNMVASGLLHEVGYTGIFVRHLCFDTAFLIFAVYIWFTGRSSFNAAFHDSRKSTVGIRALMMWAIFISYYFWLVWNFQQHAFEAGLAGTHRKRPTLEDNAAPQKHIRLTVRR